MMKITSLSHLFKWENLHNWWLTKYFFAPLYMFSNVCHYLSVTVHFAANANTLMQNNLY